LKISFQKTILTFRRTAAFFEAGCKYRTAFAFHPKFYTAELFTYDENQAGKGFRRDIFLRDRVTGTHMGVLVVG
jgi:hypothetical protein